MKVLFCTDGSGTSYYSIENFSKWFKDFTVDILSVADWSIIPESVLSKGAGYTLQCSNSVDTILEFSKNFLSEKKINTDKIVKLCGSTTDTILEFEETADYDFIILGSNGKKGFQKWMGSVSQEIAGLSKNSVYISKFKNEGKKILFTIDFSELSQNIVSDALEQMELFGKEITLLTVYETPEYMFLDGNIDSGWMSDLDKKQKTSCKDLLEKYEKLFEKNGFSVSEKIILNGNAAETIINFAKDYQPDLLVSGMRNKKYLSRFVMGSVSRKVLENVKSDVLIFRPNIQTSDDVK